MNELPGRSPPPWAQRNPPHILIVDDDPMAIHALYQALGDLGEIRFATSGREALDRLRDFAADLVLLDANMPELDGYGTCVALKKAYRDIPVIFVTAAHDTDSELRALEAGAIDFISKPIRPPIVRARVATQLRLKAQSDLLRSLMLHDPLTGIANRRALDERFAQERRRALRIGMPLSLLMIDIDHFKAYNDYYGHQEGDRCLQRIAHAIERSVGRPGDLAARYGGEEFSVLMAETALADAARVAAKIADAVRDLNIPHAPSVGPRVTVSVGAAGEMPPSVSGDANRFIASAGAANLGDTLYDRADAALYAAKAAGRNRVVCEETPPAAIRRRILEEERPSLRKRERVKAS